MKEFRWEENYDSDSNTFWVANIDSNGCRYSYRIRQKLKMNNKVYYEDSDFDAKLDITNPRPEYWSDLESAKYDMYRHFFSTFYEKGD